MPNYHKFFTSAYPAFVNREDAIDCVVEGLRDIRTLMIVEPFMGPYIPTERQFVFAFSMFVVSIHKDTAPDQALERYVTFVHMWQRIKKRITFEYYFTCVRLYMIYYSHKDSKHVIHQHIKEYLASPEFHTMTYTTYIMHTLSLAPTIDQAVTELESIYYAGTSSKTPEAHIDPSIPFDTSVYAHLVSVI